MAIETIDNFNIFVGRNIDSRYGPYADETDANNNIDPIFRFEGLTVLLTSSGDQVEYWYYNGVTNNDLKPKGAAISVSGSNGQVVFYSGSTALSGSPNFTFDYTASTPIFNVTGAISASYGPDTVGFYGTASWALNVITASYASSGGSITEIIAGTNITISPPEGTGSVTINSSAAAGSGASVAATASFTNATIWNFTHNLSSRYVVIQALDNNHQQIIPETIELLDTSSARLTFPTPESGYAMATIGGTTASVALTSLEVLTNNGGAIYDVGNDLIIQPFNNLIISGNMIPGPPYTANTSSYNLGSPTAAWNHLYVANGSVVFVTGSNTAEIQYNGTHITTTKPISGSFTGSLFGTSSWSANALTASYVNPLRQNVIITGSIYLATSSIYFSGSGEASRLIWNDTDGTLELGLKGGIVKSELGQGLVTRVVNKTSPLIDLLATNYQVVVIGGAQGQRLSVKLAQGNNDANSAGTLGVVAEDILRNQEGFVVTVGLLKNRNTTGALQGETWNDGDILYLSPTVAGQITNIKPQAPNHTVIVGYVEYAHSVNGKIYVKIDNGYELDELHNVRITTSSLSTGDLLAYSSSVWINTKQLSGSYDISGSLTTQGNIIPAGPYTNNTSSFNLGSPTAAWDKIYVSNNSLHFVSGSVSSSIGFNNGVISFNNASVTLPSNSTVPTASYVTPYETAWTSYTPTWTTDGTQPTLGNGSLTGAYKTIGKTCFVRLRLYWGTTTNSGTGTFYFSLPVSSSTSWGIQMPVSILDNGNAWYQATANGEYGGFTSKTALIGQSAGGANSSQGISGTFPFTFGNLDSIQINGSYEAL